MTRQAAREYTDKPLYRISTILYGVFGPTMCFLVACLPFAAAILLLPSAVTIAATGILIGPAWTALLYAVRVVAADRDRGPIAAFWHGYRVNARQTLAAWAPYWVLLVIAAADASAPTVPLAVRWAVGIVAAVSLLWISSVLLLISGYAFRLRDILRLGLYLIFASPRMTLSNLALLVVAGATVYFTSELLLGLLAGLFAVFAVLGARRGFALIEERFTTPTAPAAG